MHNVEEYPHSYASLHIWWYFKQMYLHRPLLYAVKKKCSIGGAHVCVAFWQLALGITIEDRKYSDVWQLLQQITHVAFKQGQLMAFHL